MREDFLHYLWQFQKYRFQEMVTVDGCAIQVIAPGYHNELSGPDFFNSRLVIGNQEWAGNVEIHLRSSDWYMHGHESDPAYDNVILHVVWVHDMEIFRKDNTPLPVLELRDLVSPESLQSYEALCGENSLRWINCEADLPFVEDLYFNTWLDRLFVERLEKRSVFIEELFKRTYGDWEAVLFLMLAKNFGLNINGEAFLSIAASIPFAVIRKVRGNNIQMEALFLGQAGLLEQSVEEPYFLKLQEEYGFLKRKFGLSVIGVQPVKYFRLRPDNFPELRLVQLAALYNKHSSLFSDVQKCKTPNEVYGLLNVQLHDFWSTHYTFSRSHSSRKKKFSVNFLDLLIINTFVPLQFAYLKSRGKDAFDGVLPLIGSIAPEKNEVIARFRALRPSMTPGALQTQAMLELKKEYCDKKACLKCAVGLKMLEKQPQI